MAGSALVSGGGIGMGDVKLAAPLGGALAIAGPGAALTAALAAPLLSLLVALGAAGWSRTGLRGRTVAHGPSMVLACWLAIGFA